MEQVLGAKTVQLRGHHGKYLNAEDDRILISQDRDASSDSTIWIIEIIKDNLVEGKEIVRLKTCFGTYLTASEIPFLLGMTGRKVLQCSPLKKDSSIEWEPIRDGNLVKFKTRHGNYLRANGGFLPWRNSVTHDNPVKPKIIEWILWEVEVVEKMKKNVPISPCPPEQPSIFRTSTRSNGRPIHFTLWCDDKEELINIKCPSFLFSGKSLMKLSDTVKDKLGTGEDIIMCGRNPINNKLFPLRLELPPSNTPVHLIIVKASSSAGKQMLK